MLCCPRDDRPTEARSRLEMSLIRLNRALSENAKKGETMDSLFSEWQSRLASHRDELAQRLEAIDAQLDGLTNGATPRLSIVGEAEEPPAGTTINEPS
jgi:hypothetical protein